MITVDQIENTYLVSFFNISKLNILNYKEIELQLLPMVSQKGSSLTLNLNGIRFVDSSGFEALLSLYKTAKINDSNLKLINALTKTHTIVTIGSVFAYFIGCYIYDSIYSNEFPLFDNESKFNVHTQILIVLSGLAQFVLIINIVISSLNRSKKFK